MSLDFSAVNTVAEYAVVQTDELSVSVLDACKNAAENAIISAANERGVTVKEICIDADVNADNCIIIHRVTATVSAGDAAELEAVFSNVLGVPVKVNAE